MVISQLREIELSANHVYDPFCKAMKRMSGEKLCWSVGFRFD